MKSNTDERPWFRYAKIAILLTLIPVGGAAGFMILEGWDLLDALYMSVITFTTVGYSEVHPLSDAGRIFVMVFLLVGIGVFLYGAGEIGGLLLRGQLAEILGSRRMDAALKTLNGHIIICGFGRMGRRVCSRLAKAGRPFIVIDRDEAAVAAAEAEGWRAYRGDATDDRILHKVGIDRARGLASVLSSDSDNLYVVLSARLIREGLQILARATDEKSYEKMVRAGANRVVNIYEAGAHKMAQLLENENLDDFVELIATRENAFDIAQFTVPATAEYCGRTLAESGLRTRGIIIVAIQKQGGSFVIPPPSDVSIQEGDRLIAIGKADDIATVLPPAV